MSVRILDPLVSERIAAGEVIERPASVVKELVENSLDAGAENIQVSLEDGGKLLIEVLDNGKGMDERDLELCVLRHATSKIQSFDDLESLCTLGFRGEALPSVAAASELEIISKVSEGSAYRLAGSNPEPHTFGHFLGSQHGTRIRAKSLFSQIPARLKFLKSARSEVSQIRDWIERLSISHPSVGFRLISQDKALLEFSPHSDRERIARVLTDGDSHPLELAESSSIDLGIKAKLYWIQGLSLGHTKKLIQVVNRRILKDRLLNQALLQPFRQHLLPGQFPALALFMDLDPSRLDVNIHPTKTEVRFLESSKVFVFVQKLAEALLFKKGAPNYADLSAARSPLPHGPSVSLSSKAPATDKFHFVPRVEGSGESETPLSHSFSDARYLDCIFRTYLLFELEGELGLVDQHAAHERVRYEKLKNQVLKKGICPEGQSLLMPETISIKAEDRSEVERRLPLLEEMGFEAEFFGDQKLLFRSVPALWGRNQITERLKGLLDRLLSCDVEGEKAILNEEVFEKLASEACHSAIRAGRSD